MKRVDELFDGKGKLIKREEIEVPDDPPDVKKIHEAKGKAARSEKFSAAEVEEIVRALVQFIPVPKDGFFLIPPDPR